MLTSVWSTLKVLLNICWIINNINNQRDEWLSQCMKEKLGEVILGLGYETALYVFLLN